jgi:hypothetical protein
MADKRSYTAGRFALIKDGSENLGFVKSLKGAAIKGEVAVHQLGPDHLQKKHLATIKHEPFDVEVGMGMSAGFYEWIRASFDNACVAYNGEIVACNFDGKVQSRKEYYNALITEVTLPALDGSSKEPAYMTVKIEPEYYRMMPGDESQIEGKIAPATKKWLCSNFRIEIGDLPCDRVAKVDSFTWKQSIVSDEVGKFREPIKVPAKVEVPNLKLSISMADIGEWQQWHRTFVIDGQCAESDELSGMITFLGPDLKEELASITLQNIGIISLETQGAEANKEEVARFDVELYVEQMKFDYKVKDA